MFKRALGVLIVCLTLPYALSPIYRFPAARPFAGPQLVSPYAGTHGGWLRSNFHAHARAWGGLTNGAQDDTGVIAAYRRAGYQIAVVSDYQHISGESAIPVYEHGFNIGKHHQLVIGVRTVDWLDYPIWQGVHQKQFIINRLKPSAELLSINHPSRLHSYTVEDVRQLTGYDLMEVANGRVTTEDRWDAALSTGHPVWAIGGDDTHDVTDASRMAVAWTMIDSPTTSPADVIAALRAGRMYTVVRTTDTITPGDLTLVSVVIDNGTLTVTCDGAQASFAFIGQGGAVRKNVPGTRSASYVFRADDTYIRTVIHGAQTDLFLNPVFRSEDRAAHMPIAVVDPFWTPVVRAAIVAACAAVIWALF